MSNNTLTYKGEDKIANKAIWRSFEDVHNAFHDYTGGDNGHMGAIETSAFNPIFWLHHTNIDRLFAMWQLLNEGGGVDAFVTDSDAGYGNWSTKSGELGRLDTPLYPFKIKEKVWHKSNDMRKPQDFGYTYPETAKADRKALIEKIAKLYAPLCELIKSSQEQAPDASQDLLAQSYVLKKIEEEHVPATVAQLDALVNEMPSSQTLLDVSTQSSKRLRNLAPQNKYFEWITNIKAEKHTLDGRYTVHVFLGPVDETNVSLWPLAPTHVDTFAPLCQPTTTGCAKCVDAQRDHTEITSQITLTMALGERYLAGLIDYLTPEKVVDHLKSNLHWRVVKGDGTVLENRREVEGLTVFVIYNEVTLPEGEGQLTLLCSRRAGIPGYYYKRAGRWQRERYWTDYKRMRVSQRRFDNHVVDQDLMLEA